MLALYLKVSLPIILPTDLKSDTFLVPLQIIGGIHKTININKILTLIEQLHLVRHVKETFSCRFILIPFIKFSIFFLIYSSFSVTFFFFFFLIKYSFVYFGYGDTVTTIRQILFKFCHNNSFYVYLKSIITNRERKRVWCFFHLFSPDEQKRKGKWIRKIDGRGCFSKKEKRWKS